MGIIRFPVKWNSGGAGKAAALYKGSDVR
jgi:hypothetical protein